MPTTPTLRRRFGSFILALAVLAIQLGPVVAAEITTDLWVYQYGDTVTVTGVDFGPEETVELVTTDPYAVEVDRGTAQTDLYGGFTYSFTLLSDVPGIYDVVATGLSSGLTAATQFDPPNITTTFSAPSAATPASGDYSDIITFSGTVRCVDAGGTSIGNKCTTNAVAINIQLKLGATWTDVAVFSQNVVFAAGAGTCTTSTSPAPCIQNWTVNWQAGRSGVTAVAPGTYDVRVGGTGISGFLPTALGAVSAVVITPEDTATAFGGDTSGIQGGSLDLSAAVTDESDGSTFVPDAYLASTLASTDGVRYQLWDAAGCLGSAVGTAVYDDISSSGAASGASLSLAAVTPATYYLKTTYPGNTYYSGSSDCDSVVVSSPDALAPTVTFSFPAADGNNGWFISDPVNGTVNASDTATGGSAITAINCTDSLSGISLGLLSASGTTGSRSISVSGEGTHNISCTATDAAGNTTNPSATATVKIDTTDPLVTVTAARAADFGGWYNAPVSFNTAGTDATSGVSDANCTADQNYTGPDGNPLTVSGSCTDDAGNVGNGTSAAFQFDDTNPSVTVTPDRSPDHNGWYNAPVTFDTAGTDATSGVADANCTANQVYSTPDGTEKTVSGSCTDNAGNVGNGTSAAFDFDNTNPTVQFTDGGLTDGASYYFGFVPAGPTTCDGEDDPSPPQSGFDECTVEAPSNPDSVGSHTYVATGVDLAGNETKASLDYEVLGWTTHGFYQPVDMFAVNTVKGGSTVPLKFEAFAGSTELTSLLVGPYNTPVVDQFLVTKYDCSTLAELSTDAIETTTTGGTSLRYDSTGGQFIQNWQTKKLPETCWRISLYLSDGSDPLVAFFKLR